MKKIYFVFQDGEEEPLSVHLGILDAHEWCAEHMTYDPHARLNIYEGYYELI